MSKSVLRSKSELKRTPMKRTRMKAAKRPVGEWGISLKPEKKCRICPRAPTDLHHAVPRSICPPEAKLDLRNGLPLCAEHHVQWHLRSIVVYRDVFTVEEWAYLSGLVLTGREITGWLDKNYPPRP